MMADKHITDRHRSHVNLYMRTNMHSRAPSHLQVVSWEDPFFPGSLDCTADDGVFGTYTMSDFSHCNSAATGNQDNYLLSSRATSTVISIAKDGLGT